MKKIILLFFIILYSFSLFSQTQEDIDVQLAAEYYSQGRIEESIFMYQNILKHKFNQQCYETLLQIYYSQKQNKEAEALIKKAIKQNPNNNIYIIDLGQHYLSNTENKQAKKTFDRVINNLTANSNEITHTATIFLNKNNLEYAVNTYLKGRELLHNTNLFSYELGYIYQRQGKYDLIAQEYIFVLENNPSMLNQIKIYLGNLIAQSDNDKLLVTAKKTIIEKVQHKSDNVALTSLLVWIYLQEKDYNSALAYAIALDKRSSVETNGDMVFEVSEICLNNANYEIASQGYLYIISKGKYNPYYSLALAGSLSAKYFDFIANQLHSEKEKKDIENKYISVLNETGKNANTAPVMLQFANLLAYYLDKPQEAVDILNDIVQIERISPNVKAESQLTLADILLMNLDIWGASLEYSKVALEFKNDETGSRAKFSKARLSYFIGEFEQAAMQFDALRSSTSKFIANDAMEYSFLISDNIDEDSTYNALTLFAKADLALYQHNTKKAKAYLDTININYLYHPLFDEILLKRAEIAIEDKQYQEADSILQTLILKYPYDITADDALFLLAQINETFLQNKEKAREYYEKIILDYPSSLYATQSRKRYKMLSSSINT
ncbi:MAG: tetratricopeptide repeat protein [Bacteroidales bacterium]|jgi:tetratricopeptide (TPR) repeat protein|nr:tetratricopeptide repeat protein [Bacteroidales bacterium]